MTVFWNKKLTLHYISTHMMEKVQNVYKFEKHTRVQTCPPNCVSIQLPFVLRRVYRNHLICV